MKNISFDGLSFDYGRSISLLYINDIDISTTIIKDNTVNIITFIVDHSMAETVFKNIRNLKLHCIQDLILTMYSKDSMRIQFNLIQSYIYFK